MKRIGIWRLIFVSIILVAITITNLSNTQKSFIYQLFGRTFSESITHKTVALPVLSIEKTIHSYTGDDTLYLVEYAPQNYVFMQTNDDNAVLQNVLNGNTNFIAVKVIPRYTKGYDGVKRQFGFSESDIMELPENKRQNLLRSRIVSLTQYDGLNLTWLIFLGLFALMINIIITITRLFKRSTL